MLAALRNAAFRRLTALYTLNSLLEWFGSVALMVVVYDATGSAVTAATMLACKQMLPALAVPFLGRQVERVDVRCALAVTFVANAAAVFGVAFAGYSTLIFPLAAVAGASGAIGRAILRGAVGRTLSGADLRAGNACLNAIMGIAAPIAPGLAALLIAASGAAAVLLLSAVVLVALAAMSLTLPRLQGRPRLDASEQGDCHAEAPPAGGPSAVPLPWLLALAAVAGCAFAMDDPSLIAYSSDELSAGVAGLGAIYTSAGVGITVGSLLFTRVLGISMIRIYVVATAVCGASFIGMGVAPSIELACAFAFLGGAGAGMDWVALVTAVQEAAPRGDEIRAAARLESIAMGAPGVGLLLGGVVAELFGSRAALLVPGALALGALAVFALALRIRVVRVGAASPSLFSPSISGGSA